MRYKTNWKIVGFWLMGSILIFFGSMIAGKIERGLGVTQEAFLFAFFFSLILIMVGGLFWILVSIAIRK